MNSETTFQSSIKPGLIISAIYIALSIIFWALAPNIKINGYLNYITTLFIIVMFVIFTRKYRDENNEGFISYGKAFSFMFYMSLLISIAALIYNIVLINFLDPAYIDSLKQLAIDQMAQKNLSEEQMDLAISIQNKMLSPIVITLTTFLGVLLSNVIIALVISMFVRKENQITFE